jgi:ATP-binding cassette, subfamily B, bacterial
MSFFQKIRKKMDQTFGLWGMIRLVWESSPSWSIASLFVIGILGVAELGQLYFIKKMVDAVMVAINNPTHEHRFHDVAFYIGLSALFAFVMLLSRALSLYVSEAQSQKLTDHIHEKLHAKSLEVDLEYYENSAYYDSLHLVQKEAPVRPARIIKGLSQVGQYGIGVAAIVGLLFFLHWSVAAVLIVAFLPGLIVRFNASDEIYRWQKSSSHSDRASQYFSTMLMGESHAKEIRLFGLGSLFSQRFLDLRSILRKERLSIAWRRFGKESIANTFGLILIFGSYTYVTYQTVRGTLTLGDFVLYLQGLQRGQLFLLIVLGSLADLYEDNLFLSHLKQFLGLKRTVIEPVQSAPMPNPLKSGIHFENLSFRYPNDPRKVLHDVTMHIQVGEKVALVGENGSGKTTLIKLLCRLYDPTSGKITLDGTNIRDFDTTTLRREISVVFQDYIHYNLTARENIWFGNIDAKPDPVLLDKATRFAGADGVISQLQSGYETMLGRLFENGQQLSIGQWQKIALARAFWRPSQIIVLDEPSSAMDPRAEYEMFQRFYDLIEGRTALLISHRLSTVKMADRIFVLQDGMIAEQGTHSELIERRGMYAELFESQAQNYR